MILTDCVFDGRYHVFFSTVRILQPAIHLADGVITRAVICSWNFKGESILPDTAYDCDGDIPEALSYMTADFTSSTGNVNTPENHANVIIYAANTQTIWGGKKVILSPEDYPDFVTSGQGSKGMGGRRQMEDGPSALRQLTTEAACCCMRETLLTVSDLKSLSHEGMGYMWECPDIFELDGNTYMTVSPQGIGHEEYRYQNTFSSGYFRIKGDVFRLLRARLRF